MKKLFKNIDRPLLILTVVFTVFGLIMIYSSSSISAVLRYNETSYYFFLKQLIIDTLAYAVSIFIVLRFPTKLYEKITPLLIIGLFLSLVLVLSYGIIINNSQSWFKIAGFSIQPTEFAKSVMIIYIASFFSRIKDPRNTHPFFYITPLLFGGLSCLLILAQPDLGGAVILGTIVFLEFLSVPYIQKQKLKIFKILGVLAVLLAMVVIYAGSSFLSEAQLGRLNFRNPCSRYTAETGYQVCNGFIAINNGGLLGKGLGNSTQKYLYLPESHTDFIFPIICEELGVIVGIIVLIGYVVMLYRIFKIAKEAENLRGSLLAYGTFLFILMHILINILGVLALLPLTGVPLPLLSYGGSFGLNIIVMLFVVQRVAIESKIAKRSREIRNL